MEFEALAVACCIADKENAQYLLDEDLITLPGYKGIIQAITFCQKIYTPNLEILKAIVEEKSIPFEIKDYQYVNIYSLYDSELKGKDFIAVMNIFHTTVSMLEDRQLKHKDLQIVREVGNLLGLEGKREEAIALLKTIEYHKKMKVMDTQTGIEDSIKPENIILTGISEIDHNGGWGRGTIVTFSGDTGSKKTMITVWLLFRILKLNPTYTIVFFSKEMPLKDIYRRLASNHLEVKYTDIVSISTLKEQEQATKWQELHNKLQEVYKNDPDLTSMVKRFKMISQNEFQDADDMNRIVGQLKPDLWCLDFYTLLENNNKDMEGDPFYKKQATKLKAMSENHNCLGIVIAQLKQSVLDDRQIKIPRKNDIEYGKQIAQVSPYMYSCFNPSYYLNMVEYQGKESWFYLVCTKLRFGKPKDITLNSNPDISEFTLIKGEEKESAIQWLNDYKVGRHKTIAPITTMKGK